MTTGFMRRDKGKTQAQIQYVGQKAVIPLAGGGQVGAPMLTGGMIFTLSTTGSSGDSFQVPAAATGLELTVENPSSNPYWCYGSTNSSDTINGLAATVGVRIGGRSVVFFAPLTTGGWVTEGLGSGYSGNYPTSDNQNALTAHAGGGSTAALVLPAAYNRITVVGTSGDSVKLPSALLGGGISILVANGHSSNPMQIYGNSSGDGNFATQAGTVNSSAGQSIAAGKLVTYTTFGDGVWHGNPSS